MISLSRCAPECDHKGALALLVQEAPVRTRKPAQQAGKVDTSIILHEERDFLSRVFVKIPPGAGLLKAGAVLAQLCGGPFARGMDSPLVILTRFPNGLSRSWQAREAAPSSYPCFIWSQANACDASWGSEWATAVLLTEADASECDLFETTNDRGERMQWCPQSMVFATAITGPAKLRATSLKFHPSVKTLQDKQTKVRQLFYAGIELV
jgi:hypothetical protein